MDKTRDHSYGPVFSFPSVHHQYEEKCFHVLLIQVSVLGSKLLVWGCILGGLIVGPLLRDQTY